MTLGPAHLDLGMQTPPRNPSPIRPQSVPARSGLGHNENLIWSEFGWLSCINDQEQQCSMAWHIHVDWSQNPSSSSLAESQMHTREAVSSR